MKNSIKKNQEFKKIYEEKNFFATKNLVMYVSKKSDLERNRLGISVSHKVGNSVVRHTLTRRIREIYKKNEDILENGIDIIIVLRVGADEKEFLDLNKEFLYLCEKHGVLKEKV